MERRKQTLKEREADMVAQACHLNTGDAEGELPWVLGKPGLHFVSKTNRKKKGKKTLSNL